MARLQKELCKLFIGVIMLVEKRVLDISDITDKIVLNKVFYSGREEKREIPD